MMSETDMRWMSIIPLVVASCAAQPIGPESRTIWRVPGTGFGMPAVDAAAAYFMSATHDITAIDKTSGSVRWTAKTGASGPATSGFNLVVAQDVVVMPDAALYAFSRSTGELRWRFAPPTPPPGVGLLDSDGSTIYAGSIGGTVYAVDAATGAQRWAVSLGGTDALALRPTFVNGVVYVGIKRLTSPANSGSIVALDAATGTIRWQREIAATDVGMGSGVLGRPVLFGDLVVFSIQDGSIRALDVATGAQRWLAPRLMDLPPATGGSPSNDDRPLGLIGTTLVAGSTTGFLVGLDVRTGAQLWQKTDKRGSAVFPIATDAAHAYVTYFGGQLAKVRASDGVTLWLAGDNGTRPGDFAMTPAIEATRLYVAGPNGYFALRTN